MTEIKRGDIVRVSFEADVPDDVFDSPHPAVVLQNNDANRKLNSTVVIPVTSGSDPHPLREVYLPEHTQGVENDSLAVVNQITTISIPDHIKDESDDPSAWKMGEVTSAKMEEIEQKILYILSMSLG